MKKTKQRKELLLTHTDLDGYGCRILAEHRIEGKDTELHVRHLENNDVDKYVTENLFSGRLSNYTHIYMTDIAVNPSTAEHIDNALQSGDLDHFELFDHHKSALHLNQYDWAHVHIEHSTGKLACGTSLFYEYLRKGENPNEYDYGENTFVERVRRYDTWEWKKVYNDEMSKSLNDLFYIYGGTRFRKHISDYLKGRIHTLIDEEGMFVLELEEERIMQYYQSKKKHITYQDFEGYQLGIVHADKNHSEIGMRLGEEFPEIDIVVILNIGEGKMSFRTQRDDIDLSEIAKQYGGGGHQQSAGAPISKALINEMHRNLFS